MMKKNNNKKSIKKHMKVLGNIFYDLAPLTRNVTCCKLQRDGENKLVSFCQTNTLVYSNIKLEFYFADLVI